MSPAWTTTKEVMNFFKPEDFENIIYPPGGTWGQLTEAVIKRCNSKLENEGKVVYAENIEPVWNPRPFSGAQQKALLINIEPIEKCKHPKSEVWGYRFDNEPSNGWKCGTCGSRVWPETFSNNKW